MNILKIIILITALAGIGGTGLGGLIGTLFHNNSKKTISFLLSFAAGVMLSIVSFDLLIEAISQKPNSKSHILLIAVMIIIGYKIIFLINYIIDNYNNYKKKSNKIFKLIRNEKQQNSLLIAGIVMSCAIALHNIPEGIVIGASYIQNYSNLSKSLILAIVIGLHNIPEGMSVSVPLIAGGMLKQKAVFITAVTGIPTIIGAIIGYSIGLLGSFSLMMSLSFASGAMLYVIFGELIPDSIYMWRYSKLPAFSLLIGVIVGMIIIYF